MVEAIIINEDDTIRREVLFQKNSRKFTDKIWASLYVVNICAFLVSGFVLLGNAKVRFDFTDTDKTLKMISPAFQIDLQECCNSRYDSGYYDDLCDYLQPTNTRNRRVLQEVHQEEASGFSTSNYTDDSVDTNWLSTGNLEKGQGVFDTFDEYPGVIFGLLAVAVCAATLWVTFLRYFSKTAVFGTEFVKVALLVWYAVVAWEYDERTTTTTLAIAVLVVAFAVWKRDTLVFAARIIKQSTIAMQENPSMIPGLVFVISLYVVQAFLFVAFFTKGTENVEVLLVDINPGFSYCEFRTKSYVGGIQSFLCFSWLWSIFFFNMLRLSIVASTVGSWHFHSEHKPRIVETLINCFTTSLGTISVGSLATALIERVKRFALLRSPSDWVACICCCAVVGPFKLLFCCFGACLEMALKAWTKFAIICHTFTSLSFVDSGAKAFKILSRHFEGGFVTEYSSRSTIFLGAYAFSIAITFIAWAWVDDVIDVESLKFYSQGSVNQTVSMIGWLFFILFNLWYPVLGIYFIILIDKALTALSENSLMGIWPGSFHQYWVSPLAAAFVGCISMMFFQYMAGFILDIVDVLFFCFVVDIDNDNIEGKNKDFHKLMKEVPGYIGVPTIDPENTIAPSAPPLNKI